MNMSEPVKKKTKIESSTALCCGTSETDYSAKRNALCTSVTEFKFNKKRVRVLSNKTDLLESCNGVVYWMWRDQRVQGTQCPWDWISCLAWEPGTKVPEFVKSGTFGAVVTDFLPLRLPLQWLDQVVKNLEETLIPVCQVDAHNIVPCWQASDKLEYGARTIRPKITKQLQQFLTEFPPVIKHPHCIDKIKPVDWQSIDSFIKVDSSDDEIVWAQGGTSAGNAMLELFCNEKLKFYHNERNNPTKPVLSDLSPWFHFGQLSVQRAVLRVKELRSKFKESVESFIEEAVVRRELSDNFCFFNKHYDSLEGAYDWARKTLIEHKSDKREYVYTKEQLATSDTHDHLWNAAQTQLVHEGKMHGFLRMYWAKKILEWTESPEIALETALYFNDRYALDGNDPNGFVGCMWSICGIHDQGWKERPVFGKIRFMNFNGCKRKFDVNQFIQYYKNKKGRR